MAYSWRPERDAVAGEDKGLESVSLRNRVFAVVELAIVIAVYLSLKSWAAANEVFGGGSIAVLSSVLAGTILYRVRGRDLRDLGLHLPSSLVDWLKILLLTILAIAAIFVGTQLVTMPLLQALFPEVTFDGGAENFAFFLNRPHIFVLYILFVVWIGAAFGEELFFRGFVMNNISEVFGSTSSAWLIALIGQSVLFGLAHGYQGVIGIGLTGSVGLTLGVVYLIGHRTMLPLIFAHGFVDTLSLTQYYLSASQS